MLVIPLQLKKFRIWLKTKLWRLTILVLHVSTSFIVTYKHKSVTAIQQTTPSCHLLNQITKKLSKKIPTRILPLFRFSVIIWQERFQKTWLCASCCHKMLFKRIKMDSSIFMMLIIMLSTCTTAIWLILMTCFKMARLFREL